MKASNNMITLRHYQQELIDKIQYSWKNGNKHLMVCSPTASGKTVIFSYIAQQCAIKGTKVLILSHREELLHQTMKSLSNFNVDPHPLRSGVRKIPDGMIITAMAKTLAKRLKKNKWIEWYETVGLVIIDEAHLQDFNFIFDIPQTKDKWLLGFSATPKRTGMQRQLSEDYEEMITGLDVQDLINLNFLVPDKLYSVPFDLKGVRKSGDDYDPTQLYERYDKPELYAGVIDNYKKICPDTIAICFCVNIQHTINTCKAFNEAGIKAKFLVSPLSKPKEVDEEEDMGKKIQYKLKLAEYENYISNFAECSGERRDLIRRWKAGEFKVLVNSGIATTGFDFPEIHTVIMDRATMSDNLWLQCCGRGARISDNKEFFYLLDFGNNSERLGFYRQQREYSLDHETRGTNKGGAPSVKQCPKCKALLLPSVGVCKYCGHIFEKTREEVIVELKEVRYKDAMMQLHTSSDIEAYARVKNYPKTWVFRMIYEKLGFAELQVYCRNKHYAANFPYILKNRFMVKKK